MARKAKLNLTVSKEHRAKANKLAKQTNRSISNLFEVLIDKENQTSTRPKRDAALENHLVKRLPVKVAALALLFVLFSSCAGIERINAKHKSDSQLKLRLSQVQRELGTFRFGEGGLHDVSMLESERDAIERELLSRYEAGDNDAYLAQFRQ